jgi:MFS family permease
VRGGRGAGVLAFALLGTAIAMPTLVGLLAVDLTSDLSFGDSGLGLVVSAFWLVTAVSAPLCGRWIDARGWPLGATLGALVAGATLLAAVLLVDSWAGLLGVLAVSGLAYALCSPTSNLLVVTAVPRPHQASVLGFKQTAPPLVAAVAGATLPTVAHAHGWRTAMALGLVMPVSVLIGTRRLVVPASSRRLPEPVPEPLPAAVRGAQITPPAPGPSLAPVGEVPPPLRALPVVVAAGLGTFSVATVTGFAVLTLVAAGLAPVPAAAVVSVGSLLAVIARVAAGAYLDSRPARDLRPLLVLMGVATFALGAVGVGVLAGDSAPATAWDVLVVVGVVLALVAAWTWPALLLIAVVRSSAGPGAASGLLQLGSGLGSAVGPLVFGVLSDAGGRGWAWLAMAALTVMAGLLVRRSAP